MQPDSTSLEVLSVSPLEQDHLFLQAVIDQSPWSLFPAIGIPSAMSILERQRISVVLCERDLTPGSWSDLLTAIQSLPDPPCLIVFSSHADDRLWAEALNLGAWDVLQKPFEPADVLRCLKGAFQRRQDQRPLPGCGIKLSA